MHARLTEIARFVVVFSSIPYIHVFGLFFFTPVLHTTLLHTALFFALLHHHHHTPYILYFGVAERILASHIDAIELLQALIPT